MAPIGLINNEVGSVRPDGWGENGDIFHVQFEVTGCRKKC